MKVFKFGGASVESTEKIDNVANIIQSYNEEPLLIVISAIGQTTNELEKVAENFHLHKREIASQLLYNIKIRHYQLAEALTQSKEPPVIEDLKKLFKQVEWQLGEKPYHHYDYYYDQIVSLGELLSTTIISNYFNNIGLNNYWLDTRSVIRTDDNYRDANIDWDYSLQQVQEKVKPIFEKQKLIIAPGFVASTDEGHTTTLGREGSDYTAAIFTNLLDAESLSIWKDVEGLKNADPKLFENTVNIAEVNYNEVIEMAYYGAQVIHPKTIKPLQNKEIPLLVKCFLNKELPGTIIHKKANINKLPPIIVLKRKQVLLRVTTKDFSFITEENLSRLYNVFHSIKIKINLTQNGAISFSCCIEHDAEKIEQLMKSLHNDFKINYNEGLELLTVRNYKADLVNELIDGKEVMLEQRSPITVQLVMKPKI